MSQRKNRICKPSRVPEHLSLYRLGLNKFKPIESGVIVMPYEIPLNVIEILKSTLYLLEHTIYPGKDGKTVTDLKRCIAGAIQSLGTESPQPTGD